MSTSSAIMLTLSSVCCRLLESSCQWCMVSRFCAVLVRGSRSVQTPSKNHLHSPIHSLNTTQHPKPKFIQAPQAPQATQKFQTTTSDNITAPNHHTQSSASSSFHPSSCHHSNHLPSNCHNPTTILITSVTKNPAAPYTLT